MTVRMKYHHSPQRSGTALSMSLAPWAWSHHVRIRRAELYWLGLLDSEACSAVSSRGLEAQGGAGGPQGPPRSA